MSHWKTLVAEYSSGNSDNVRMNPYTSGLLSIPHHFHTALEGKSFYSYRRDQAGGFSISGDYFMTIATPDTATEILMALHIEVSAAVRITIFNGCTVTYDLSHGMDIRAINDKSAESPAVSCYYNPTTISAYGDEIWDTSGIGTGIVMSANPYCKEYVKWVLKRNNIYVIRLSGTATVNPFIFFDQVTPIN